MVAKPHGGKLVSRVIKGRRRETLRNEAKELPRIVVNLETAVDIENIAHGVFSPLEGFLGFDDYISVLNNMRLSNDIPWTIPVTLDVDDWQVKKFKEGEDVAIYFKDKPLAVIHVEEIYSWNKKEYAKKVYGTLDINHPGVLRTYERKDFFIAGTIDLIGKTPNPYERYTLWPVETRILFKTKGWKRIVAFQTRNAPHLGHEYVQKAALTFADGLFINPLIGKKKKGDYRDDVILAAYETLIKHYYPKDVVVLAILRTEMRYAGPREAIHHAIMRKNFGCTHIIIGRDHAGVGNYYGPYEAWEIFNDFPDLGIIPMFIREAFYCEKCGGMVNEKICPHKEEFQVRISGTLIRKMLKEGKRPPEHMMRPEVADTILKFKNPFI